MNFIFVLFAHFIGDTSLQPGWMLRAKKTNWYVMMEHCIVYTAAIAFALAYFDRLTLEKMIFLGCGHYLIDTWKANSAKDILDLRYLYIDQTLHIIQLLIVYFL